MNYDLHVNVWLLLRVVENLPKEERRGEQMKLAFIQLYYVPATFDILFHLHIILTA